MEIQKYESSNMVQQAKLTSEQIDLIKKTVCKESNDDELQLFLHVSNKCGLDPFSKQIYAIKRKGSMTIQTGIDGYRLIAARTSLHAGTDDAVFEIDSKTGLPISASVTVYKLMSGNRIPFTATARYSEYVQQFNGTPSQFWLKMPFGQLAKCAEALALRKAFPQELSGIYTNEEMQQADNSDVIVHQKPIKTIEAKPLTALEATDMIYGCNTQEKLRETYTMLYKNNADPEFRKYLTEEKDTRKAEIQKLAQDVSKEFFGELEEQVI